MSKGSHAFFYTAGFCCASFKTFCMFLLICVYSMFLNNVQLSGELWEINYVDTVCLYIECLLWLPFCVVLTFNQDGKFGQDIWIGHPAPPLPLPARGPARSAPAGLAFQFSPSSLTDFFVRPQKIQILVALVQCIPLSEKLCNYCDIFYLIYFLLKCIACDSEILDYFITVIDFQLLWS